jgi:hypothetical protein
MQLPTRLGVTALVTALLLSAALSTSSARNLSVSNENIRVTWSRLEFQTSVTVRCHITLEGRFHSRTIAKVARTLIGLITRVDIHEASCTGGRYRPLNTPWHLTYESFSGTLPNITSVRLLLARFRYELRASLFGIPATCFYGNETDNITYSAAVNASREVTELTPVTGRNTATLIEGTFGCPGSRTLVSGLGDGRAAVAGTTTRIRVTLI